MIIETITFPHLRVGDIFTFRGSRCTVTRMTNKGFFYSIQNDTKIGWMDYWFYMNTPSAKGRKL